MPSETNSLYFSKLPSRLNILHNSRELFDKKMKEIRSFEFLLKRTRHQLLKNRNVELRRLFIYGYIHSSYKQNSQFH